MKVTQALAFLVVSAAVIACAKNQDTAPAPTSATSMSQPTSGDLGKQKSAGPYSVILMSPSGEVSAGDAHFMAHVTKDGKDVEDVKVELSLSMPSMSMEGPHVDLKHTTGNAYEGIANVMAGAYVGEVEIEGPSGKASVKFDFTVK
jgi:hypothetical protein